MITEISKKLGELLEECHIAEFHQDSALAPNSLEFKTAPWKAGREIGK